MVWNATWDQPTAEKADHPLNNGRYNVPTAVLHPDPQVSTSPRVDPVELGIRVRSGQAAATAHLACHPSPGEVARVAVPSITKEYSASYSDPPGTTSGSATRLAPLRVESRPDRSRHPGSGRFAQGESIAAGHVSLDSQPSPLAGRGGPQAAQFSDPMSRPAPSRIGFNALPVTVAVNRLDLAGPAGLPLGLARQPDPSPVSRASATLDDGSSGTGGQSQVPQGIRGSFAGAPDSPGPLATGLAAHNAAPMLGVPALQATGRAPGE